jgi:alpha-D-ribose 1-methylphosphonate 5-triphosphate synthase subunit PhnH
MTIRMCAALNSGVLKQSPVAVLSVQISHGSSSRMHEASIAIVLAELDRDTPTWLPHRSGDNGVNSTTGGGS